MSTLIELAREVTRELAPYDAEMQMSAEYELSDLVNRKVLVVPVSPQLKILSRAAVEAVYEIEVGIMLRMKNMDLPELVTTSEEIGKSLLKKVFSGHLVVSVEWPLMYDPDALRTRNLFISVIRLKLKGAY